MAGIGFRLRNILREDSYSATFKAHLYSTLISAGPWILSIITLFALGYWGPRNIDLFQLTYFRAVIIYIFAFSLIVVGVFHYPLTRYLADKLYANEEEALVPVFNSSMVYVLAVQSVIGISFFWFAGVSFEIRLLAVLIYLTVTMIWLIMIFLTALKDYHAIAVSYAFGAFLTIYLGFKLGTAYGLSGYFAGYLIGHLVIVVLWSARVFIEFRSERFFDTEFFSYFWQQKTLLFTGFFYGLALWIDKIIFWYSPDAVKVAPLLQIFPVYESTMFVAYLTIIPTLSLFLIQVETDFFEHYRRYYKAIVEKASFETLKKLKSEVSASLRRNAGLILRYQGIVTLVAIVYAPKIADLAHLKWTQIPILRVGLLGAFLHSVLLVVMLIILYFDFRRLALAVSFLYLITNALFTLVTTHLSLPYYGYGYLAASLLSLIVAYYALDAALKRLEYWTFAMQPMGVHREEEVS